MNASSLKTLHVKIYKSINAINPSFRNEMFRLIVTNSAVRSKYKLNLDIPEVNQVSSGNKNI